MPTIGDNLIDPGEYLDGRVTLDRDAGVAAIERSGTALGWGLERSIDAILQLTHHEHGRRPSLGHNRARPGSA